MRLRKSQAIVLVALLGAWGLFAAGGLAARGQAGGQIRATYRVDLAAFNLGELRLIAKLNGSAYEVQANGKF